MLAAVALSVALGLGGCGLVGSGVHSGSTPTHSASASNGLNSLQPLVPVTLTAASAQKATVNLAKQLESLVASTDIVHVDDHAQLVPATTSAASYYGDLRTITVSSKLDPNEQATAMEKLLVAAGWTLNDTTSATGRYLAALSSSVEPTRAWFLLLGGDSTVATSPVVTLQLASPDLPK